MVDSRKKCKIILEYSEKKGNSKENVDTLITCNEWQFYFKLLLNRITGETSTIGWIKERLFNNRYYFYCNVFDPEVLIEETV
jgi:hypothetical protein